MKVTLTESLKKQLISNRRDKISAYEAETGSYIVYGSFGVELFVTLEGQFVIHEFDEKPNFYREVEGNIETYLCISLAATLYPEFKAYLPKRPSSAIDCVKCEGAGKIDDTCLCNNCGSLGWINI